MESYVILLAAVNLFLLIVLLLIMKKHMSLNPPEPVKEAHSDKLERIRRVISEQEPEEEDDLKAFVLGMIAAGRTDEEIVSELRKKGLRERDIKNLLEGMV